MPGQAGSTDCSGGDTNFRGVLDEGFHMAKSGSVSEQAVELNRVVLAGVEDTDLRSIVQQFRSEQRAAKGVARLQASRGSKMYFEGVSDTCGEAADILEAALNKRQVSVPPG